MPRKNSTAATPPVDTSEARSVETTGDRDAKGRFLSGHGGPGRPKGSRNRLAERFLDDLHQRWEKSGADALARMAKDDPGAFVKVVATTLPHKLDQTLSIDVNLFEQCQSHSQAWRLARSTIGADDVPLLIEAETENAGETVS